MIFITLVILGLLVLADVVYATTTNNSDSDGILIVKGTIVLAVVLLSFLTFSVKILACLIMAAILKVIITPFYKKKLA